METFSPNFDKISENIIYLLSLNSRRSVTSLSKELSVSRKMVENRVNKLFQGGYIKPLAVTNERKRCRFTIFAKLSKIDSNLIKRIKQIKGLLKLKETLGIYDLSILFDTYSYSEANAIISKISNLLHNSIITFDVLFHDYEDTLGYKSFCHNITYLTKHKMLSPKKIDLSEAEERVLNILKKFPNIPYLALSKETKISYVNLKKIVNHLVDNELVRFSVDPDYEKIKLEFHNILVKIKLGKKKLFEDYIKKHPRIHWVKYSRGRWDYVLSVTAKDINEFIDISKGIRTDNNRLILEETSLISKIKEIRKY